MLKQSKKKKFKKVMKMRKKHNPNRHIVLVDAFDKRFFFCVFLLCLPIFMTHFSHLSISISHSYIQQYYSCNKTERICLKHFNKFCFFSSLSFVA